MKNVVLKYGVIAGIVLAAMIFTMGLVVGNTADFDKGEIFGYIFMVAAYFTIYFGIRNLRDNVNGGIISFNMAFRTGLLITIIGSVFYVAAWMIYFNFIDLTFMERYSEYYVNNLKASGMSADDIEKEITAFKKNMADYKNPFKIMLFTFMEVFPIGLVVSILCAFLMKKKPEQNNPATI